MARESLMSLTDRHTGLIPALAPFEQWRVEYCLLEHDGGYDWWFGKLRDHEVPSDRLRKTIMSWSILDMCDAHREEAAAFADSK